MAWREVMQLSWPLSSFSSFPHSLTPSSVCTALLYPHGPHQIQPPVALSLRSPQTGVDRPAATLTFPRQAGGRQAAPSGPPHAALPDIVSHRASRRRVTCRPDGVRRAELLRLAQGAQPLLLPLPPIPVAVRAPGRRRRRRVLPERPQPRALPQLPRRHRRLPRSSRLVHGVHVERHVLCAVQ